MGTSNAINADSTGIVKYDGAGTFSATTVTQFDVLVGGVSNAISSIGPGAAGQVLQSGGNAANPAYSTATYPSTTTINQILYSSANNTISEMTAVIDGVLISSHTGVPSLLVNSGTPGFVLTANAGAPPSWQASSSSGITTINGDSGSITGATVTIKAGVSTQNCGSSVQFTNGTATSTMNVTDANNNSIIGKSSGNASFTGIENVSVGSLNLGNLTTGSQNSCCGFEAGFGITTGNFNTYLGFETGNTTTGSYNTCVGELAGSAYSTSESSNILIGHIGVNAESNVLRIGTNGSSAAQQNKCFIAGIEGVSVSNKNIVTIDTTTGQMGSDAHVLVPQGGTGIATTTAYGVICGGTTATGNFQNAGAGLAGQILQSGGAAAIPAYSTATYPATAGTSGNVLTSDGTNWNSTAFPTRVTTINGDSGSATGATITFNGTSNAGSSVSFSGSGATISFKTTDANSNVIIGSNAGNGSISGTANAGFGFAALNALTSGSNNMAIGYASLDHLTTGSNNVGIGANAINTITTGAYNTAIGSSVGSAYTTSESSNIVIGYNVAGTVSESNVLRIGSATGTGNGQLNSAFIAGITGITVTGTAVLVSASNQLGIAVSSRKFKNDIRDMGNDSSKIFELRPVTFLWNKDSAPGLKDATDDRQHGLIAEEVHGTFPYLCNYDREGKPFSVKYQDLPVILLNELQKLRKEVEDLKRNIRKSSSN